jgi:hypothetical protein
LESANWRPELDLHRCESCNHLWATSKATGRIVAHFTPLPKRTLTPSLKSFRRMAAPQPEKTPFHCHHCREIGQVEIEYARDDAISLRCQACGQRRIWHSLRDGPQ